MYRPTRDLPHGYSEDKWVCELSEADASRFGVRFVELADNFQPFVTDAKSGISLLSIDEGIIDLDYNKMYLPSEHAPKVVTREERYHDRGRNLVASTGNLPTIMVRVVDATGSGPDSSLAQLRNDVFEDASCLKSQMAACSYNQLTIQPYQDNIVSNGVHEITVNVNAMAVNRGVFEQAMLAAFESALGSDIDDPKFGLVMFCVPPGSDSNFSAIGIINGKITIYAHDVCGRVSGHLHEVGHNLNLPHSGEGTDPYGDGSGVMGYTFNRDDQNICYNAVKSWQLGWYSDRTTANNPRSHNTPFQTYLLNGVADYRSNPNALVVLQLDQPSLNQDYYIGYNRKTGINSDTVEDGDKVTIHRKDASASAYVTSWKVASLNAGESYTITNYNNQGGSVEIRFPGTQSDGRDAKIEIFDLDRCTSASCPTLEIPCATYTIEVKTDNYPGDTSWTLVADDGSGRGFATQEPLTQAHHLHEREVCIPYDTRVKFTILDGYGDGMCCFQGVGYYRILDPNGSEIATGDSGFEAAEHVWQVGPDPNPSPTMSPNSLSVAEPTGFPTEAPTRPPTRPPTRNPTNAPVSNPTANPPVGNDGGNCEMHTVAVTTDNYPEDTSWSILKDGQEVRSGGPYTEQNNKYRHLVCLERDADYTFVIVDNYQDGLCCFHGQGSYQIKNSNKVLVVESEQVDEVFHVKEVPFRVEALGEASTECRDKTGKFRLKRKKGKKKKCSQHAADGKCDSKYKGAPLWKKCPVSCNRCDDI